MRNDFCTDYLEHSAKGKTWTNHKYVAKVKLANDKWYYFYTMNEYQAYLKGKNKSVPAKAVDKEVLKNTINAQDKKNTAKSNLQTLTSKDLNSDKKSTVKTTSKKAVDYTKKSGVTEVKKEDTTKKVATTKAASDTDSTSKSSKSSSKKSGSSSKKSGSSGSKKSGSSGSSSKKSGSSKEKSSDGTSKKSSSGTTKEKTSSTGTTKTNAAATKQSFSLSAYKYQYDLKDDDISSYTANTSGAMINTSKIAEMIEDMADKYPDNASGCLLSTFSDSITYQFKWVKENGQIKLLDPYTNEEMNMDMSLVNSTKIDLFRTDNKKKKS